MEISDSQLFFTQNFQSENICIENSRYSTSPCCPTRKFLILRGNFASLKDFFFCCAWQPFYQVLLSIVFTSITVQPEIKTLLPEKL